ncbi:hypothetical protein [Streptomyces graminilatus]|uniref:hypothetical protein n=1 Tax=Streptomyces graminilatus TaxID=1464070 RepID=UPI0006E36753|nr:hypothetical protein [Streptomyces graminilatus]
MPERLRERTTRLCHVDYVLRCWRELRHPCRAVPALETALAEYDDVHARDKDLYMSWLADSYMTAGEVAQAAP